ncbi:hypothetical protein [Candidatus Palauibacter sp.]|uniref:hypothetical protein n=1 Tax=Candidatus Palauibacter sp. TaxID=3101350 RepID=UPI003AF2F2A0
MDPSARIRAHTPSNADGIGENGETSTTVTVSITNGKTFAADQVLTIHFGGTATEESTTW